MGTNFVVKFRGPSWC